VHPMIRVLMLSYLRVKMTRFHIDMRFPAF
jgi:hypothetical protein